MTICNQISVQDTYRSIKKEDQSRSKLSKAQYQGICDLNYKLI